MGRAVLAKRCPRTWIACPFFNVSCTPSECNLPRARAKGSEGRTSRPQQAQPLAFHVEGGGHGRLHGGRSEQ
eukprot:scaffold489_cov309-Pavlova_lutheri.AAC.10